MPLQKLQHIVRSFSSKSLKRTVKLPLYSTLDNYTRTDFTGHHISHVDRLFGSTTSQCLTTAPTIDALPLWEVPEIAFAGRSNVGKSTLINAIFNTKDLVFTSKTPGRTQALNFFSVGGKKGSPPDLCLVDMPGYGFAATASGSKKQSWLDLISTYITNDRNRRGNCKCVFVLLDSKVGIKSSDMEFLDFLHAKNVNHRIVWTKVDQVKKHEMEKSNKELTMHIQNKGVMVR